MKRLVSIVLALCLAALLGVPAFAAEEAGPKVGPNVGDKMKPFKLTDPTDNKEYELSKMLSSDKETVLFFMNSTCSLCRAQEKLFMENWGAMQKKVNLYLVSVDFDGKRLELYKKSEGIPFPILHDPNTDVLSSVEFSGTPGMVVLDGKGVIKDKISGYKKGDVEAYVKRKSR